MTLFELWIACSIFYYWDSHNKGSGGGQTYRSLYSFILYLWITSFPTAFFCSTQLPSSSAVLEVLWYARGELVMAV